MHLRYAPRTLAHTHKFIDIRQTIDTRSIPTSPYPRRGPGGHHCPRCPWALANPFQLGVSSVLSRLPSEREILGTCRPAERGQIDVLPAGNTRSARATNTTTINGT